MKKNGLTLVEVLVGAIILAVLVLGSANIFLSSRRYIQRARILALGGELQRTLFGALNMDVRQDQWGTNCLSGQPAACSGNISIDGTTFNPQYTISTIEDTKLLRVRLKINWNDP